MLGVGWGLGEFGIAFLSWIIYDYRVIVGFICIPINLIIILLNKFYLVESPRQYLNKNEPLLILYLN